MHRWLADADVTRYITLGTHSLSETEKHLHLCLAEQQLPERTRYYLAVALQNNSEIIGGAGFEWLFDERREGDLGYFLLPPYWGKGMGTDCARLVLQLAFTHCGAEAMRASCDARNAASERVMQKCGMRRDTSLENPGRLRYVISRAQWLGSEEATRLA